MHTFFTYCPVFCPALPRGGLGNENIIPKLLLPPWKRDGEETDRFPPKSWARRSPIRFNAPISGLRSGLVESLPSFTLLNSLVVMALLSRNGPLSGLPPRKVGFMGAKIGNSALIEDVVMIMELKTIMKTTDTFFVHIENPSSNSFKRLLHSFFYRFFESRHDVNPVNTTVYIYLW